MKESEFTKQARDYIKAERYRVNERIRPLIAFLNEAKEHADDNVEISLSHDEIELIISALAHRAAETLSEASDMERALDCGDEYGYLENHGEKNILNGCVGLLCKAGVKFREYLDFIGVEPSGEEELYMPFGYREIVHDLFLLYTGHSGGTSTNAKCRMLGVDPCGKIDICEVDEDDE